MVGWDDAIKVTRSVVTPKEGENMEHVQLKRSGIDVHIRGVQFQLR